MIRTVDKSFLDRGKLFRYKGSNRSGLVSYWCPDDDSIKMIFLKSDLFIPVIDIIRNNITEWLQLLGDYELT
jgi:hypothetical protein